MTVNAINTVITANVIQSPYAFQTFFFLLNTHQQCNVTETKRLSETQAGTETTEHKTGVSPVCVCIRWMTRMGGGVAMVSLLCPNQRNSSLTALLWNQIYFPSLGYDVEAEGPLNARGAEASWHRAATCVSSRGNTQVWQKTKERHRRAPWWQWRSVWMKWSSQIISLFLILKRRDEYFYTNMQSVCF